MRPFSGVLRRRRWPAAGTKSGVSTKMAEQAPEVGIIMGSQSDWPTMRHAADVLDRLGIAYEVRIVSAHRTPQRPYDYSTGARDRGPQVIVTGAGGAAHTPSMAAALAPPPG